MCALVYTGLGMLVRMYAFLLTLALSFVFPNTVCCLRHCELLTLVTVAATTKVFDEVATSNGNPSSRKFR